MTEEEMIDESKEVEVEHIIETEEKETVIESDLEIERTETEDSSESDNILHAEASETEEEEVIDEKAEEEISDPSVSNETSELDETIMSHAIEVAFEHASDELIEDKIEEETPIEKPPKKTQKPDNLKEVAKEKEERISAPVRSEDMTFIEWLKYKQSFIEKGEVVEKKKDKKEKKKKKKDKKKKKRVEKAISPTSIINEENEDEKMMSKTEINDLLDKFIKEEPSISKPQKEFFNPSKSAKKSLEESNDLVSETLAKIHEMQGNYSKAITAYKQLSLLYPEKKAFFASRIEKIKGKLDEK
jgi:hypothetical protein